MACPKRDIIIVNNRQIPGIINKTKETLRKINKPERVYHLNIHCHMSSVFVQKIYLFFIFSEGDALQNLTTALAIVGKVGFAGSFSVLFIYTSELFPTEIR